MASMPAVVVSTAATVPLPGHGLYSCLNIILCSKQSDISRFVFLKQVGSSVDKQLACWSVFHLELIGDFGACSSQLLMSFVLAIVGYDTCLLYYGFGFVQFCESSLGILSAIQRMLI